MSALPNILPPVDTNPYQGTTSYQGGAAQSPQSSGRASDGFDQMMSRAMSPADNQNQPVQNQQNQGQDAGLQSSTGSNYVSQTRSDRDGSKDAGNGTTSKKTVTAKDAKDASDKATTDSTANQNLVTDAQAVVAPVPAPIPTPTLVATAKGTSDALDLKVTSDASAARETAQALAAKNAAASEAATGTKAGQAVKNAATTVTTVKTDLAKDLQPVALVSSAAQVAGKVAGAGFEATGGVVKGAVQATDSTVIPAATFPKGQGSSDRDSQAKTQDSSPSDSDGTPAAQQNTLMNNAEKAIKTASSPGKNLPGGAVLSSFQNNLPVRTDFTGTSTSATFSALDSSSNLATATSGTGASGVLATFQSATLERANELIALQASRMTASTPDSVQVVIKPGQGTELSLNLRQNGNGIDATAIMQQGDYGHLAKHWPELQQQLEQRGIRLAPLSEQTNFDGANSGSFQQQTNDRPAATDSQALTGENAAKNAPGIATTVLPGMVGAQKTQATSGRSWETWA